jgi:RNA polymerase subunit RPABC4/transcription elongation factor Spt4
LSGNQRKKKRICSKCKRTWVVIYTTERDVCPICALKG